LFIHRAVFFALFGVFVVLSDFLHHRRLSLYAEDTHFIVLALFSKREMMSCEMDLLAENEKSMLFHYWLA